MPSYPRARAATLTGMARGVSSAATRDYAKDAAADASARTGRKWTGDAPAEAAYTIPVRSVNLPTLDERIRQVLLEDWDPHNAARNEAARGSYDLYIAPLRAMLTGGADEEAVVDWLKQREEETMCFPALGTRRLRSVALKLLALRETSGAP